MVKVESIDRLKTVPGFNIKSNNNLNKLWLNCTKKTIYLVVKFKDRYCVDCPTEKWQKVLSKF